MLIELFEGAVEVDVRYPTLGSRARYDVMVQEAGDLVDADTVDAGLVRIRTNVLFILANTRGLWVHEYEDVFAPLMDLWAMLDKPASADALLDFWSESIDERIYHAWLGALNQAMSTPLVPVPVDQAAAALLTEDQRADPLSGSAAQSGAAAN